MNFVSQYFENPPIQWGFRGDPRLWEEMKIKMATEVVPKTADELEELLQNKFYELTGEKIECGKKTFILRYKHIKPIGMSSGIISHDFWLNKGFPLILQRYNEREK